MSVAVAMREESGAPERASEPPLEGTPRPRSASAPFGGTLSRPKPAGITTSNGFLVLNAISLPRKTA